MPCDADVGTQAFDMRNCDGLSRALNNIYRFIHTEKRRLGFIILACFIGHFGQAEPIGGGYDILTRPVSLLQDYGVTEEKLSRATALFLQKVPEVVRMNNQLQIFGLRVGTFGGTSREVIQAIAHGIVHAGSYDAYIRELEKIEVIGYLDWHRLGSDLDLIILGTTVDESTQKQVLAILNETFPPSLFYKTVDIIYPHDHFSKHPIMSEHFEATSDIVISQNGFEFIPELIGTVDGHPTHFGRWGVQQFLTGIFDFRVNPQAPATIRTYQNLRQVLRWVRYSSEFPWVRLPESSLTQITQLLQHLAQHSQNEVLQLFKSGNSLAIVAYGDGEKTVETLEKLQLYSADPELTVKLLERTGLTALATQAGINLERLFRPLRDRTPEEELRAKSGRRLGREMTVHHRSHLHAVQNIGLGALWLSDNKTMIKGRTTMSAYADAAVYAAEGFDSLYYGDFYVSIPLSPDAVEGVDYIKNGAFYALKTKQAVKRSSDGRLQIKRISQRDLIENSIALLHADIKDYQRQSVLNSLATLLNPYHSQTDRKLFLELAHQNDTEYFLEKFFSRTDIVSNILTGIVDSEIQDLFFRYLDAPMSDAHFLFMRAIFSNQKILDNVKFASAFNKCFDELSRANETIWSQVSENRKFMLALRSYKPQLWAQIATAEKHRYSFDLADNQDMSLFIRILNDSFEISDSHFVEYVFEKQTESKKLEFINNLSVIEPMRYFGVLILLATSDRSISSDVKQVILSKLNLSMDEAKSYKESMGSFGYKGRVTQLWQLLKTRFHIKSFEQITILSEGERIQALNAFRKAEPQAFTESELKGQFERLTSTVLAQMIADNSESGDKRITLDRYLHSTPPEFFPQLSERDIRSLYDKRYSRGRVFDHATLLAGIGYALQCQTHLPMDIYRHIMTRTPGRLEPDYSSVIRDRPVPDNSESFFLRELRRSIRLQSSRWSAQLILNFYRSNVTDLLYDGKGWTPGVYQFLLSVWRQLPRVKDIGVQKFTDDTPLKNVKDLLSRAPELPSGWRKKIVDDFLSRDLDRIILAGAVLFSRSPDANLEIVYRRAVDSLSLDDQMTLLIETAHYWPVHLGASTMIWWTQKIPVLMRLNKIMMIGNDPENMAVFYLSRLVKNARGVVPYDVWSAVTAWSKSHPVMAAHLRYEMAQQQMATTREFIESLPARGSPAYLLLSEYSQANIDTIQQRYASGKIQIIEPAVGCSVYLGGEKSPTPEK